MVATSTTTASKSSSAKTLQLIADNLIGLSQHINQLWNMTTVVAVHECVRCAGIATARCSANPVDVVLGGHRIVDINNVFNILNVCVYDLKVNES